MNPPGPVLVLDHPGIGARPVPVHASAAAHPRASTLDGLDDLRERRPTPLTVAPVPSPGESAPWQPMGHPSPDPSPSPSVAMAPPTKGHQQACSPPHQQACAVTRRFEIRIASMNCMTQLTGVVACYKGIFLGCALTSLESIIVLSEACTLSIRKEA
jgi:hypothetical protein